MITHITESSAQGCCGWFVPARAFLIALAVIVGIAGGTFRSVQAQNGEENQSPLTLSAALTEVTGEGSRVRMAEAAQEAAGAGADWRTSSYLPQVRASVSTTQSQYPLTVTGIREPGRFPPLDERIHELRVNASWTVYDFGRSRAERRAAQVLAEAAGLRYDLARMEAIEAVTEAFIRLAQLDAVEAAQERRLHALESQRRQVGTLVEEGRAARVDQLKIEEVFLDAQADLRATRREQENVLRALSAELGRDEPPSIEEVEVFLLPSVDPPPVPRSAASESAPRVRAAEANLSVARARAKAARRSFLPSVELFGIEQIRSGTDWEVDSQWMAGVRVNVPLLQFGLFSRGDAGAARVREQAASVADARRRVRAAYEELTNRIIDETDRVETSAARVERLVEAYRIELAAYREGRLTLTDLLATEAGLSASRSELTAARASLVLARLRRSVLTGDLTSDVALELTGIGS